MGSSTILQLSLSSRVWLIFVVILLIGLCHGIIPTETDDVNLDGGKLDTNNTNVTNTYTSSKEDNNLILNNDNNDDNKVDDHHHNRRSGRMFFNTNSIFDFMTRRRCPLCDSSVYSYCGDKLFHDSCCCSSTISHNHHNPYEQLPYECQFADCSFLHSNSCDEHKLITACCCVNRLY